MWCVCVCFIRAQFLWVVLRIDWLRIDWLRDSLYGMVGLWGSINMPKYGCLILRIYQENRWMVFLILWVSEEPMDSYSDIGIYQRPMDSYFDMSVYSKANG